MGTTSSMTGEDCSTEVHPYDALAEACTAAAEANGYAWLAGALEGCVRNGWGAQRTADFLARSVAKRAAV
jgi:hypothetical protein